MLSRIFEAIAILSCSRLAASSCSGGACAAEAGTVDSHGPAFIQKKKKVTTGSTGLQSSSNKNDQRLNATSTTNATSFTPMCQGDASTWHVGSLTCANYAVGASEHEYCDQDFDQGFSATQVCVECGVCQAPLCQGDASTWDAGYGSCANYAVDASEHEYCGHDHDQGFSATQVCVECGVCQAAPTLPTPPVSRSSLLLLKRNLNRKTAKKRGDTLTDANMVGDVYRLPHGRWKQSR